MAALDVSDANCQKKRKRSPNFSKEEVLKLEEEVTKGENLKVLTSKFSTTVTNKLKNEIWEHIASEVSSLGVCTRTAQDCSNKWQNLKREAKEAMTEQRLEQRMTGGGPKKLCLTSQHERIVSVMGGSASFSGITGGIDSDECDGMNYMANLPQESAEEPQEEMSDEPETSGVSCSSSRQSSMWKLKDHMSKSEVKKTKRVTQEDLAVVQMRYFEGEIAKQSLEMRKLELQIKLLQKMDDTNDRLTAQDLFAALPFLSQ